MKRLVVLFLAFAAITFTAQAQQGQERTNKGNSKDRKNMNVQIHRFNGGDGFMIPDLSDGQKDEIKKLRIEMNKETNSIHNQIAEKRARINTLQSQDKADMSAINKTIDEIAALQAQQMKAKANFHVKVRALLNDEQKVAFDSRRPHRNFNFDMGRGMGEMKMKSFRLGDADFDAFEGLELPEDFDCNSLFEQHFGLEIED